MKQHYIRIKDSLVPVSRKVYTAYYKALRREKYLVERDQTHGLLSYHALDTDEWQGENVLPNESISVEDAAIHVILLDRLEEALNQLSPEDKRLILLLFGDKSERSLVNALGIPRTTLQRKKTAILQILKNIFEKS